MAYAHTPNTAPVQSYSIPSIAAIVCAVASFFFGAGLGLILAVLAIILGLIGVLISFSPNIRGGMISTLSVGAGVLGIVAALLRLIF